MSERSQIAGRIEALLAKRQEKGATLDEEDTARRKALDLIDRYGFTRAEFGIQGTDAVLFKPAAEEKAKQRSVPAAFSEQQEGAVAGSRRIAAIDAIRGAAIVAMVVYHTAFDLSVRDLIPIDIVTDPGWTVFARSIASTFLLLVGVSLVLATRNGLRIRPYLRRLALIAVGAVLVTLVTWWVEPREFIFFGILHEIAVASVLALPFVLWLPSWVIAPVAAGVIALPFLYASPVFDSPALWWVGLSANTPITVDYVPIFPWFGVVLAGIVVGRLLVADFLDSPFSRWRPSDRFSKAAIWAGRWSLLIYLVHQPILYGLFWAASPFVSPNDAALHARFMDQCTQACRLQGHDDTTCNTFCGCMFTNLNGTDLMTVPSLEAMSPEQRSRWDNILVACRPPVSGN